MWQRCGISEEVWQGAVGMFRQSEQVITPSMHHGGFYKGGLPLYVIEQVRIRRAPAQIKNTYFHIYLSTDQYAVCRVVL